MSFEEPREIRLRRRIDIQSKRISALEYQVARLEQDKRRISRQCSDLLDLIGRIKMGGEYTEQIEALEAVHLSSL